LKEATVQKKSTEKKVVGAIEDAFGLPPGDKTPHGQGKPMRDTNIPHGTLTSEDSQKADEALTDCEESRDDRRPTWTPNP
jgi:hypothetical protein